MLTPAQWNELVPPGTRVRYWPVKNDRPCCFEGEDHIDTKTRSAAWTVGGQTCVKVDGIAGGVHTGFLAVRADALDLSSAQLELSRRRSAMRHCIGSCSRVYKAMVREDAIVVPPGAEGDAE